MSDNNDFFTSNSKVDQKVLLLGSVSSGKATAIKTLCDSFTMNDSFSINDNMAPIILSYGELKLSDSESLLLYASPEQKYSEQAWTFLQSELIGLIFLIDNRGKDPLKDLETFLLKVASEDQFKAFIGKIVIGITHFDNSRTPAISDFHSFVDNLNLLPQQNLPIFSVDTRNFRDMSMLLQTLLYSQEPTLNVLSPEKSYS